MGLEDVVSLLINEKIPGSIDCVPDILSIYVASVYWVIASFSSVGYGDISPATEGEMIYALLIEMLGICVFGYMIGTI